MYDSVNLTLYNIIFTSAPILAFGLFEQNLPAASLESNARHYRQNARNRLLTTSQVMLWLSEGFAQCLLNFFIFYFCYNDANLGLFSFGIAAFTSAVIIVNLRLLLQAKSWNVILVPVVFLSIATYFAFS